MENSQNTGIQTISDNDAERIADSLAAALESRRQRAERSVINSFARQNNVSPDMLLGLLQQRKGGDEIPDDVQAAIDRRWKAADDRLICAEIRNVGAQFGLIDADAAFALMDKSEIHVDDDGSVSGVLESLQDLLKNKPYLAGKSGTSSHSTGSAGNFPRGNADASDYASRLALARSAGNNTLAAALIAEAAAKGIQLR